MVVNIFFYLKKTLKFKNEEEIWANLPVTSVNVEWSTHAFNKYFNACLQDVKLLDFIDLTIQTQYFLLHIFTELIKHI